MVCFIEYVALLSIINKRITNRTKLTVKTLSNVSGPYPLHVPEPHQQRQLSASSMPGLMAGVVVLITIAVLGACTLEPAPQGEPLNWASVVADANLAGSVYAIGVVAGFGFGQEDAGEERDGWAQGFIFIGTGFAAHYPDTIWTNAHVAEAVRDAMGVVEDDAGNVIVTGIPVAVRSGSAIGGTHTHRLNMDTVRIHPEYDAELLNSPDVAVIHLDDGTFRDVPSFLPRELASGLQAGQPVGTLGFPGEITVLEAVPIATFKDGTISALRPYDVQETQVTPENRKLVQFNLGQTGGTSGSPVFDHEGFIVAVSCCGVGVVVVDEEGFPAMIPIGNLDFGIRVDEAWTLIDLIEADDGAQQPVGTRVYPHASYRAYPKDWNRQTVPARPW